jgi:predicted RNase H-like nuclease (RuvC/YqgF family)
LKNSSVEGDFTLDVARKISRRLAVSGVSTKTLEEELDDLEDQNRKLKLVAEDRKAQLTRLRLELAEWQNSERGVSKKGKKKNYF